MLMVAIKLECSYAHKQSGIKTKKTINKFSSLFTIPFMC